MKSKIRHGPRAGINFLSLFLMFYSSLFLLAIVVSNASALVSQRGPQINWPDQARVIDFSGPLLSQDQLSQLEDERLAKADLILSSNHSTEWNPEAFDLLAITDQQLLKDYEDGQNLLKARELLEKEDMQVYEPAVMTCQDQLRPLVVLDYTKLDRLDSNRFQQRLVLYGDSDSSIEKDQSALYQLGVEVMVYDAYYQADREVDNHQADRMIFLYQVFMDLVILSLAICNLALSFVHQAQNHRYHLAVKMCLGARKKQVFLDFLSQLVPAFLLAHLFLVLSFSPVTQWFELSDILLWRWREGVVTFALSSFFLYGLSNVFVNSLGKQAIADLLKEA